MAEDVPSWLSKAIIAHDIEHGADLRENRKGNLCQVIKITGTISDRTHWIKVAFDVEATNKYEAPVHALTPETLTAQLRSIFHITSYCFRLVNRPSEVGRSRTLSRTPSRAISELGSRAGSEIGPERGGREDSNMPRVMLDILEWRVLSGNRDDPNFFHQADEVGMGKGDEQVRRVLRKWWSGESQDPNLDALSSPERKEKVVVHDVPAVNGVQKRSTNVPASAATTTGYSVPDMFKPILQHPLADRSRALPDWVFDVPADQREILDEIRIFGLDPDRDMLITGAQNDPPPVNVALGDEQAIMDDNGLEQAHDVTRDVGSHNTISTVASGGVHAIRLSPERHKAEENSSGRQRSSGSSRQTGPDLEDDVDVSVEVRFAPVPSTSSASTADSQTIPPTFPAPTAGQRTPGSVPRREVDAPPNRSASNGPHIIHSRLGGENSIQAQMDEQEQDTSEGESESGEEMSVRPMTQLRKAQSWSSRRIFERALSGIRSRSGSPFRPDSPSSAGSSNGDQDDVSSDVEHDPEDLSDYERERRRRIRGRKRAQQSSSRQHSSSLRQPSSQHQPGQSSGRASMREPSKAEGESPISEDQPASLDVTSFEEAQRPVPGQRLPTVSTDATTPSGLSGHEKPESQSLPASHDSGEASLSRFMAYPSDPLSDTIAKSMGSAADLGGRSETMVEMEVLPGVEESEDVQKPETQGKGSHGSSRQGNGGMNRGRGKDGTPFGHSSGAKEANSSHAETKTASNGVENEDEEMESVEYRSNDETEQESQQRPIHTLAPGSRKDGKPGYATIRGSRETSEMPPADRSNRSEQATNSGRSTKRPRDEQTATAHPAAPPKSVKSSALDILNHFNPFRKTQSRTNTSAVEEGKETDQKRVRADTSIPAKTEVTRKDGDADVKGSGRPGGEELHSMPVKLEADDVKPRHSTADESRRTGLTQHQLAPERVKPEPRDRAASSVKLEPDGLSDTPRVMPAENRQAFAFRQNPIAKLGGFKPDFRIQGGQSEAWVLARMEEMQGMRQLQRERSRTKSEAR